MTEANASSDPATGTQQRLRADRGHRGNSHGARGGPEPASIQVCRSGFNVHHHDDVRVTLTEAADARSRRPEGPLKGTTLEHAPPDINYDGIAAADAACAVPAASRSVQWPGAAKARGPREAAQAAAGQLNERAS